MGPTSVGDASLGLGRDSCERPAAMNSSDAEEDRPIFVTAPGPDLSGVTAYPSAGGARVHAEAMTGRAYGENREGHRRS